MSTGEQTQTSASTLRRAYLTIQRMQQQLDEFERTRTEPIAVVGVGCRFPGGAIDPRSYWDLLSSGTDAVDEIPADRWDVDAFYSSQGQQPGKMSTRWGGFLDRVDLFDHDFFGISRREALAMDPQQRLALEVAWEAMENAGAAPGALAGSRTGVFMGVCSYDFASNTFLHPMDLTAYASTGTAHSVVTGRISYLLDLRGPSIAIDSACSSSLVAVHLAVRSLRSGECDVALSGGVNVVLSPLPSIAFSQFPGMVSADGRCKTFDAAANGYVRSEGCGIVVLKRLSDARRAGDHVLAVLRGGAVNQDGRSSGVTAPNGQAQRDVLRQALAASGVRAEDVSYIEAHGTGTKLGDPIEVEALADVYGRAEGTPVYLGSSKTNIGHAEAAAGIAGLIKTVLAVDKGVIPPNVHFTELNPHLSFDSTTFAVPTTMTEFPAPGGRRVAGVSSFGFSGTNAHLIVEQAPPVEPIPADPRRPLSILALSAKSEKALANLTDRYARRLANPADDVEASDSTMEAGRVGDVCYSANTGRSHFRHRLAAVAATREELAGKLTDYVDGLPADEPIVGEVGNADVVFVFTGQGPQRIGMARELYETQPLFQQTLDTCDDIVRPLLDTPLLSVIYPDDPTNDLVYQTAYSQPALFAVQYALARLWRSWGIEPVAVLGHSFGEYVAACVAGTMTLEEGLTLIVERGRLMQELAATGAMAAVFAPEDVVAEAIREHLDSVSIAAVNGPANTAISGERETVARICQALSGQGVETKLLRITTSSHSPLIEPILRELGEAASRVAFTSPTIPLVSNLSGALWSWDQAPDAEYWCRHARQPVRFAAGVATLREMGYQHFLEIGPAPTLLGLISDNLPTDHTSLLLPSLRPNHGDWQVMASTLATLYVHGADVDWTGFDRGYSRTRVALPTYPFERTHCWQPPRRRAGEATADWSSSDLPTGGLADLDDTDDDLLYRLDWQPVSAVDPAAASSAEPADAESGRPVWIVLDGGTSLGTEVADAARRRGWRCVRALAGPAYSFDGHDEAVLGRDGPDDLSRLIDQLGLSPEDRCHVVHTWSIVEGPSSPDSTVNSASAMLTEQVDGCLSAVWAAQALAHKRDFPARLWLVTQGAVRVASSTSPIAVAGSTLWGLGRSLAQEQPASWGALIDLDPNDDAASAAARLIDEITHRDPEDQIAYRSGQRYGARLVRGQFAETTASTPTVRWRKDATYLVTGGLGGLGLAVARSMVLAGAARLVLIGRTALPPRDQWEKLCSTDPTDGVVAKVLAVRELESLGASVWVESLDISDADATGRFVRRYEQQGWPAIRGIVHAAGTGDVAPLTELTRQDFERHLRPKAVGAWVLHRLFEQRPLDFFIMFSSTSSMLSSPFVASYAAANAYLDALAGLRRDRGLPGLSINWGIWSQTGLAARGAAATPGLSRGMGTMRPDQALRVFHQLLVHDEPQVAVVPVDWSEWGRRYQEVSGSPLLANLVSAGATTRTRRGRASGIVFAPRDTLAALPADERVDMLAEQLLLRVVATLDAKPGTVKPDQPLFDLGLDSLMAVELRNEVERQLGVSLPISVLLEGASVRSLAEQIALRLDGDGDGDGGAADGARPTTAAIPRVERVEDVAGRLLAQLSDMSDEQVRAAMREQEGDHE